MIRLHQSPLKSSITITNDRRRPADATQLSVLFRDTQVDSIHIVRPEICRSWASSAGQVEISSPPTFSPRYESPAEEMPPRERPHALLRRGEADQHVRAQPEPHRVAALNVPARRDVDGHDGDASAREERERSVERGAYGWLEGEAEDRVEHDVARC